MLGDSLIKVSTYTDATQQRKVIGDGGVGSYSCFCLLGWFFGTARVDISPYAVSGKSGITLSFQAYRGGRLLVLQSERLERDGPAVC